MNSHSFIQQMERVLKHHPQFHVMREGEDTVAFEILEGTCMKLGKKTEIFYSRRPHLRASFDESMQRPLMVLGEQKSFFGVISDMQAYNLGKAYEHYYTSDLRVTAQAIRSVKLGFRSYYKDLLAVMDRACFSAVLNENIKAVQALTRGKSALYYHPFIPYYSTTIPIAPTLKMQYKFMGSKEIVLEKQSQFPKKDFDYLTQTLEYCHKEHTEGEHFIIKKKGKKIGLISLYRPFKRSLKIKTNCFFLRGLITFLKKLTGIDYDQKVPWVYCTHFLLRPGEDKEQVFSEVIAQLMFLKAIRSGELLLLIQTGETAKKLKLWTAQIQTKGCMYHVTNQKCPAFKETAKANLNPLCL